MYRTWVSSASDAETLARALEAHLNEHAEDIIAVSYAVTTAHHVLAVYREIDISTQQPVEAAVTVAEQIIDEAQI
jgi:hypothetical protein